uniref:CAP-Gly domain-containing protein n=1 Tax=Anopheles albimanus TaxID=7167 RepID=A0A182F1N3_ANOAL
MEDHDSATYSIESEPPPSRGPLPSAENTVLPAASKAGQKAVADGVGTMQITKLVLKTPPGSPKRHSKTPGIIIHSLQTLASPALRTGHDHERTPDTSTQSTDPATSKVLVEHKNLPAAVESAVNEAPYRITPIVSSPGRKPSQKEHDDPQVVDSSKENKVPSQCIEVTRLAGQDRSESKVQTTIQKIRLPSKANGSVIEIKAQNAPSSKISNKSTSQYASNEKIASHPVSAARRSLLIETTKPATNISTVTLPITDEGIKSTVVEISPESKQMPPPPVPTEPMKLLRSSGTQPKPSTTASVTRPPAGDCVKKKEKSYDPVKAREFIREQQAKRRQEKKDIPEQGAGPKPSEKELIKQRLENLKRSTTSLVKKNVQKARSRSVSCAPKIANEPVHGSLSDKPQNNGRSGPPPAEPKQPPIRKFPSSPSLQQPTSAGNAKEIHRKLALKTNSTTVAPLSKAIKTSSLSDKTVAENVLKRRATSSIIPSDSIRPAKARPSSARTNSSSLRLLPKRPGSRIGIMRKPDHLSLEDVLSPVHQASSRPNQHITVTTPNAMVNAQLIVIKDDRGDEQSLTAAEKELKLDVPDVTLIPSNTMKTSSPPQEKNESNTNIDNVLQDHNEQDHHRIKSIPPWLKQSLQQPDPYPFIVAVRKKLEAVRNVNGDEDKKATHKQYPEQLTPREVIKPRTNAYLDIIHSVPSIAKQEQQRKTIAPSAINNEGSAISTNISVQGESNTSSEISSIKSDAVFPLPPLLSSTKVESYSDKFDRHPTPTSGPVSPLSVEKISGLKITTDPNRPEIVRTSQRQEEETLKENIPPELPAADEPHITEHSNRSQRELDYQRMLDAFNRSLTHVIEVNQQLYSALKKPPSPLRSVPVPQEIRKIRDEMTQTSAVMAIRSSTPSGQGSAEAPVKKASTSLSFTLAGTSTTASNYTDDFENQSQTGVGTPTEKPSIPDSTQVRSEQHIPSSVVSSSLASSSSPTTSSSSTSGSLVASDDRHSSTSPSSMSTSSYTSSGSASFTDRQKSKSSTANGRSSDFESHSSDHSDNSQNNTATNIVLPTAEEYLPSFEESLRRKQLSSAKQSTSRSDEKRNKTKEKAPVQEKQTPRNQKASSEKADNGEDSSISEEIHSVDEEARSFSLKLSEEITEQKLKDPVVQEPTLAVQQTSSLKRDSCDDVTFGSDLLATIFNRTDLEVSIMSTTVSETNLSYSSIGLYDQLIHSERTKQEHLISRVQAKQKALLNRAKGQLAWLELQKQRFREKGQLEHISGIKKKQRAVLLRLEKERSELNRTIESPVDMTNTGTVGRSPLTTKNVKSKLDSYCSTSPAFDRASLALRSSSEKVRSQSQRTPRSASGSPAKQRMFGGTTETTTTTTTTTNSIQVAIRARELEPNDRLEDILLRREEDLRKRKEHVRRLVEWHHKLDREEADLMAIEEKLRAYSNRKLFSSSNYRQSDGPTIEERMRSIEASLKTLQSIPAVNKSHMVTSENEPDHGNDAKQEEVVEMVGKKLNRLWHRLTGDKSHRYEPEHSYHVTRSILEDLYESAKRFVLDRFRPRDGQQEKGMLLEESIGNNSSLTTGQGESTITTIANATTVANEKEEAFGSQVLTKESTEVEDHAEQDTAEEINQCVSATSQEIDDTSSCTELQKIELFDEKQPEKFKDTGEEELAVVEEGKSDGLLSSTAKSWSPESRRSTASVEFHTLEETAYQSTDFGGRDVEPIGVETPVRSDSYSTTFEDRSVVESENSQMLIEDMSLPPPLLNDTSSFLLTEDEQTDRSSVALFELQRKATPDVDDGTTPVESDHELAHPRSTSDCSDSMMQSLEEATGSSGECASTATTPTTVTPTMAIEAIDEGNLEQETVDGTVEDGEAEEEIDLGQPRSSLNSSSSTSELEKRLVTLHDELEELSETFERTPLMRSPTTPPPPLPPAQAVTQTSDTITMRSEQDGNSLPSSSESESLSDTSNAQQRATEVDPKDTIVVINNASLTTTDPHPAKIEIKHGAKPSLDDSMVGSPSGNGAFSATRNYPPVSSPLANGGSGVPIGSTPPGPPSNTTVRMPDIINEAEVLRRQQLQIEQEIKELEQQVGFLREIPNKPPPPYIPPANGSPLALLFPSETRIDELINERLDELYRDPWLPVERLRSDHVTNVYEKLILDVCNELYGDLRPPEPTVSFRTIEHDKRPLAFYNPPDELRCMKEYLRRKIKRILNEEQLSLQQQHQQLSQFPYHQQLFHHLQQSHQQHPLHHHHQQQQQHQLLAQCATVPLQYANGGCANKRKRDQVDEILAEEMHEDDARWTNFDREEIEVKDRITGELLKSLLGDAIRDMAEAFRCKNQPDNRSVPLKESAM